MPSALIDKSPAVGRKLCMSILHTFPRIVTNNNKPGNFRGGEHDLAEAELHQKRTKVLRFTFPRVAKIHDRVAERLKGTAEYEADHEEIRQRIRN